MTPALRITRTLQHCAEHPDWWPEEVQEDCQWIRDRYGVLKRTMGFSEAHELSCSEWVEKVLTGSGGGLGTVGNRNPS